MNAHERVEIAGDGKLVFDLGFRGAVRIHEPPTRWTPESDLFPNCHEEHVTNYAKYERSVEDPTFWQVVAESWELVIRVSDGTAEIDICVYDGAMDTSFKIVHVFGVWSHPIEIEHKEQWKRQVVTIYGPDLTWRRADPNRLGLPLDEYGYPKGRLPTWGDEEKEEGPDEFDLSPVWGGMDES